MVSLRIQLELCIDFAPPLRLSEVETHKQKLSLRGVYLLIERLTEEAEVTPFGPSVVYIGKAIKETIFSRCRKHLWSVQDARLGTGKPRTAPGDEFKRYRESIGFNPFVLWLVPGPMSEAKPYLISCAEEYLLFEFARRHGRLPKANTAG